MGAMEVTVVMAVMAATVDTEAMVGMEDTGGMAATEAAFLVVSAVN